MRTWPVLKMLFSKNYNRMPWIALKREVAILFFFNRAEARKQFDEKIT